jgi:steroid delta-isomerase-like uncharacterized protein
VSVEQNKALIRRFVDEIFNQGRIEAIDELVAPDAVDHAALPGMPPGREGIKRRAAMIRSAFPDFQIIVEDQVAEGDRVAGRYTMRGTHQGDLMGIPPTGKPVSIIAMDVIRVRDGRLVEHWGQIDMLGMMQQLGVVPAPGQRTG